jgi:hypothetical protein
MIQGWSNMMIDPVVAAYVSGVASSSSMGLAATKACSNSGKIISTSTTTVAAVRDRDQRRRTTSGAPPTLTKVLDDVLYSIPLSLVDMIIGYYTVGSL